MTVIKYIIINELSSSSLTTVDCSLRQDMVIPWVTGYSALISENPMIQSRIGVTTGLQKANCTLIKVIVRIVLREYVFDSINTNVTLQQGIQGCVIRSQFRVLDRSSSSQPYKMNRSRPVTAVIVYVTSTDSGSLRSSRFCNVSSAGPWLHSSADISASSTDWRCDEEEEPEEGSLLSKGKEHTSLKSVLCCFRVKYLNRSYFLRT